MNAVREYRVLYDKGVKGFKDKRQKDNAWKEIADITKMTVKECEQKYSSQRTMFGRYIKTLQVPSGSGRESLDIKPEWEHLRWLITHINHRVTKTNLTPELDLSQTESDNPGLVEAADETGSVGKENDVSGRVVVTPLVAGLLFY